MAGQWMSIAEINSFLQNRSEGEREIALELRNVVSKHAPNVTERILWGGLSYHDASRGGPVKGAVCQIELHGDHVRLSFIHGIRLPDPTGLLEGDRLSKRYVRLDNYEQIPWDVLSELIKAARDYSPIAQNP
jgi:hypothetical protein